MKRLMLGSGDILSFAWSLAEKLEPVKFGGSDPTRLFKDKKWEDAGLTLKAGFELSPFLPVVIFPHPSPTPREGEIK